MRVKESDRIHALVTNLRSLGARVEEFDDGFSVAGNQTLRGGRVQSFGDHRMAMAMAIAGLLSDQPVVIEDADCVSISFPEFFSLLDRLTEEA